MKNPAHAYARVFRAYKQNAARGDPEAQLNLGMMYENGQGVPKNRLEASRWYEKAAEREHPGALARLGILHANGQGVKKDLVYAYSLFLRAEKAGHPTASKLQEQIVDRLSDEEKSQAFRMAGK
ncbi:MAG: tetratricopeptide repeat protein [Desulfatibacillaceae bacterium]